MTQEQMFGKGAVMVLSYKQINDIAQGIVNRYRALKSHPCVNVNIEELLYHLYGFKIEFFNLSKDGSILGVYSSLPVGLSVFHNGKKCFVELDGKTALIEESLLENNIGRKNFTVAHEGAHYILNDVSGKVWFLRNELDCDKKINDWSEWQANTLASCILMPEDSVRYLFGKFYCSEFVENISPFRKELFAPFEAMADFFGVSKQAMAIRLQHGLLSRV